MPQRDFHGIPCLSTALLSPGHCGEHQDDDAYEADGDAGLDAGRDRGWWTLLAQLALADALTLCLVSPGELWSLREGGGPWRLPAALCAPFVGLEAMLGAAQTYLLVAVALHAWATPADPVPSEAPPLLPLQCSGFRGRLCVPPTSRCTRHSAHSTHPLLKDCVPRVE